MARLFSAICGTIDLSCLWPIFVRRIALHKDWALSCRFSKKLGREFVCFRISIKNEKGAYNISKENIKGMLGSLDKMEVRNQFQNGLDVTSVTTPGPVSPQKYIKSAQNESRMDPGSTKQI